MRPRLLAPVLAFGLLAAVGVSACSDDSASPASTAAPTSAPAAGAPTAGTAITVVGPQEGADLMQQLGTELMVIDVRTAAEFAEGHVEGAVNYDVEGGQFTTLIADLDPSVPYLVYCRSGRRSAVAAQAMADAGFTTVYDMGGIQAWVDAGLPVVSG